MQSGSYLVHLFLGQETSLEVMFLKRSSAAGPCSNLHTENIAPSREARKYGDVRSTAEHRLISALKCYILVIVQNSDFVLLH
jgi:hypothetical protein